MPNTLTPTGAHWIEHPECAAPDAFTCRAVVLVDVHGIEHTLAACEHGVPVPYRTAPSIEARPVLDVPTRPNRARFALPFVLSIASAQSVRYFDRIERSHRAALIEARRNRRRHLIEYPDAYRVLAPQPREHAMSEGRALVPYFDPSPFAPRAHWEIERAADVMLRDDVLHNGLPEHTWHRTDVLDRLTRRMFVQPDRAAFRGAPAPTTKRGDVRTLDPARGAIWSAESPGYHAFITGRAVDVEHKISVVRRRTAVTYRGTSQHTRTTLAKGPAHKSRGVGIAYRPPTAQHGYAGAVPLVRIIEGAPAIIERGYQSVEVFETLSTYPTRRFIGARGTFPYVPRSERSATLKRETAVRRTSSTGARGKAVTVWSASDRSMSRIWSRAVNLTRTNRAGIEVPNVGADPERIEVAEQLLAVLTTSARGAVIEVIRHGIPCHMTTDDGTMWRWIEAHAISPRRYGARDMARRAVLDGVTLT